MRIRLMPNVYATVDKSISLEEVKSLTIMAKKAKKHFEHIEHLNALIENKNALIETLEKNLHGGKREGSGRPKLKKSQKKEPTVVMRIPKSKVAAVLKAIGNA